MFDSETGEVERTVIFRVLRFHKVDIADPDPCESSCTLLAKDNVVKSIVIPDPCPKRMVMKLCAWFALPPHHFHKPDMMGDTAAGFMQ